MHVSKLPMKWTAGRLATHRTLAISHRALLETLLVKHLKTHTTCLERFRCFLLPFFGILKKVFPADFARFFITFLLQVSVRGNHSNVHTGLLGQLLIRTSQNACFTHLNFLQKWHFLVLVL